MPLPLARISEVANGVQKFLADRLNPTPPDVIEAAAVVTDAIELADGKKVRVFPDSYRDAERLARRRVQKEYRVAVQIEIPYLSAASASSSPIPQVWIDQQIAWVEQNVFDPLNDSFTHAADGLLLGSLQTFTCEVTVAFDPQRLAEEKMFVSLVAVAYRETDEG